MLGHGEDDAVVGANQIEEFLRCGGHTVFLFFIGTVDRQFKAAQVEVGDRGVGDLPGGVHRELAVDRCGAGRSSEG